MSAADPPLRAFLRLAPVIPVYTPANAAEAVQVARALQRGGLPVVEVTLRTPAALDAIRAIVAEVPGMVVAAGTVLDAAQLAAAHGAGARFAVSPGATPRLLAAAGDQGLPLLPGIATASELMAAMEAGLDTFKFFPAVPAGGVAMLQALGGPFPAARFCPTGGITPKSAADFLQLSNVVCLGGSWLTPPEAIAASDWAVIETFAREAFLLTRSG